MPHTRPHSLRSMRRRARGLALVACVACSMAVALPARAGALAFDSFGQFSFHEAGSQAQGCQPADAAGDFCIPSSGTPTAFLDAPAWTFAAGPAGAVLTVIDVFLGADRFEVFDFGVSIGITSALVAGAAPDCGDDPLVCLATPGMSQGSFALGAGGHSITIVALQSDGSGSAYLQVTGQSGAVAEPASAALLLAGLAAAASLRRRSAGRAGGVA